MAVITREQLGLHLSDEEWGRGYETSRNQTDRVTFHRPATMREKVYDVVNAASSPTRGDIARALGLKKTPWLTAVIEGLVNEGYLIRKHDAWKNGCLMYRYEVAR